MVFAGGGANELMAGTRRFNTGIAARGRIYVANDNRVYAFTVPVPPILLTKPTLLPGGTFQFTFTNVPGLGFTAFASTNAALPFTNWTRLGTVPEVAPGQFEFNDLQPPSAAARLYQVRSP